MCPVGRMLVRRSLFPCAAVLGNEVEVTVRRRDFDFESSCERRKRLTGGWVLLNHRCNVLGYFVAALLAVHFRRTIGSNNSCVGVIGRCNPFRGRSCWVTNSQRHHDCAVNQRVANPLILKPRVDGAFPQSLFREPLHHIGDILDAEQSLPYVRLGHRNVLSPRGWVPISRCSRRVVCEVVQTVACRSRHRPPRRQCRKRGCLR
mmetsp:Transcript_41337/g.127748  ORF Transcript_41337/g.127748 Transcript_41337/m.127748 type:complete len:204 (-) Transcript_41337:2273-2884(-)